MNEKETASVATETPKKKNSFLTTAIIALVVVVVGIGAYYLLTRQAAPKAYAPVTKISKEEMELLVKDLPPQAIQQLTAQPEKKAEIAKNLTAIFAAANQAVKEGIGKEDYVKREMDNISTEVTAIVYDRTANKDKGPMPPFGSITADQVEQFYAGTDGTQGILDKVGLGGNTAKARAAAFESYLNNKIEFFKKTGAVKDDREISEDERKQAREYYAKTRLSAAEANDKINQLGAEFKRKVDLQIKVQQAQTLSQIYQNTVLSKKLEVSDADVEQYIAAHPEIDDSATKKAKAEEVLQKAKSGGDFAKLAEEYSEDPGSKSKGGLYENIVEGSFVPEFEQAAFALEPGQITPDLVKSGFGYHIIKLIKKGETKQADGSTKRSFDVRQILISTMKRDEQSGRDIPLKDYVKALLTKEKQEAVQKEMTANSPVEVASDFELPQLTPEQIEKMKPPSMPPVENKDSGEPKPTDKTEKPPAKK